MKKNKMMRIASVLLVAVLLSTCAISGTFAKYVTKATGTDTARVAKWGVRVEVGSDLFATQYATHDTSYSGALSVKSSTTDNVVAPGTGGTFAQTTITGTPEVAVRIDQTHKLTLEGDWEDESGNFYCPIVFNASYQGNMSFIGGGSVNGLDYASKDALEAALNGVVGSSAPLVLNCGPNTDLSTQGLVRTWSWEWAFEGATGSAINQSDEADTYLGNIAAGLIDGKTVPSLTFESTVIVTQID